MDNEKQCSLNYYKIYDAAKEVLGILFTGDNDNFKLEADGEIKYIVFRHKVGIYNSSFILAFVKDGKLNTEEMSTEQILNFIMSNRFEVKSEKGKEYTRGFKYEEFVEDTKNDSMVTD